MGTATAATQLDIDRILAGAEVMTGRFAKLPAGLRSRLTSLMNGLSPAEAAGDVAAAEMQLRSLIARRLLLAADRQRLPGIAAEQIRQPVFVIGFSRTGTTLLHSLLSLDEGARAPRWWHTHAPSPPPGEKPVAPGRLTEAAHELQRFLSRCPGLLALHPYWDDAEETLIEDEQIATLDLQNAYPSLLFDVGGQEVMGQSFDPTAAHRFQQQFLQHLQWNTAAGHWVCKGVYHQFALASLFEVFPDALCIWPHRDPVAVQASTLAIATVVYGGINRWQIDRRELASRMVHGTQAALQRVVEDPLVDDPRIFHVQFADVVADPVEAIAQAYRHWQRPLSTTFSGAMRAWLNDPANSSDRYGRYDYSLEPYGFTPSQVRDMFGFYRKRFGLD